MHLGCRHTHPMFPRDVSLCAVTAAMQATQINLGCAFHHVDAELLHIRYQIIQRHTLPVVVFSALSLFSSAAQQDVRVSTHGRPTALRQLLRMITILS
jgi:hypothetical protein